MIIVGNSLGKIFLRKNVGRIEETAKHTVLVLEHPHLR